MNSQHLKDTITLLRFPFSLFLMPVFWYALLLAEKETMLPIAKLVAAFFTLHFLVYPSSNAYNSYFDKDEDSIGGLEKPPMPNELLLKTSHLFDIIALIFSFLISQFFFIAILVYIAVSRAYSHPKTRLKKMPIVSLMVVALCQGSLVCLAVSSIYLPIDTFLKPSTLLFFLIPAFFLASSYPLTQIYQHDEDKKRGDNTLSLMLGINNTFLFSQIFMAISTVLFLLHFGVIHKDFNTSLIFVVLGIPVLIYFSKWQKSCQKDPLNANFKNTMSMNMLSSLCTTSSFLLSFVLKMVLG